MIVVTQDAKCVQPDTESAGCVGKTEKEDLVHALVGSQQQLALKTPSREQVGCPGQDLARNRHAGTQ
jgi:hypothetical protein